MDMGQRTTWKKIAAALAAGLAFTTCADHSETVDGCPFCADVAARRLYENRKAGRVALAWRDVADQLAERFQHFEPCAQHSAATAAPETCPFCGDAAIWQAYVHFCLRRGVAPITTQAEHIARTGRAVPLAQIPRSAPPGGY